MTNLLVIVNEGNVARALAVLKKEMLKRGIFKEMKKRGYYEKPSVKKRRKQKVARAKARKATKRRVLLADAA